MGAISDLDVTEDKKAAVTLRIDDTDFTPWKADASCDIGSQGLIGEKFVECEPGTPDAEPLREIKEGDGEGERLLPVANTTSPVDLDLINNTLRLPYRERFSILLNEFGTALAGRGSELNEVIHRANPALRETDEVLEILSQQNRELARLARNSDTVLAPLAREKEAFADFIVQANATGEASAERRGDIARGIELLPDFLAELEPLMADLEGFADQGTPLFTDLNAAAPALGRMIKAQGTLADASRVALPSLGDALERGRPALIEARPLIQDLNKLGTQLAPVSVDLDQLTESLEETGGPERINDFLYYAGAGHQRLRQPRPLPARRARDQPVLDLHGGGVGHLLGQLLQHLERAGSALGGRRLRPATPAPSQGRGGGSVAPTGSVLGALLGQGGTEAQAREREQNLGILRERARTPSPGAGRRG